MYHRWICLLLAWTVSTPIAYGQSPPLAYVYDKTIGQTAKINLSTVVRGDYSEIRWDMDADGLLDQWVISEKNITITQKFGKQSLEAVSVLARRENFFLKLIYRQVNSDLKLVHIEKIPHQSYFGEPEAESVAELDILGGLSAKSVPSSCPESPYKKVLGEKNWNQFQCRMTQEAREEDLERAIDKSCGQPLLTVEQRKELKEAVREIYGINFTTPVEHNKILKCLSTGPSRKLNDTYPSFLAKITSAIAARKTPEIKCVLKPAVGCGLAKWDSGSDVIEMPITKPACAPNMKSTFAAGLFHEKLHQSNPKLEDPDIKKIVKGCLSGDFASLKDLDEKYADLEGFDKKHGSGPQSPALVSREVASISKEISANIPESVAAGQVLPLAGTNGSGSIFTRAMSALNIGTRNIASVNPNQELRLSQGRTAPVLKTFGFLGGVPQAQAAPVAVVGMDNPTVATTVPSVSNSDSVVRGPASNKTIQISKVSGQNAKASGGVDGRETAKVISPVGSSAKIGLNSSGTTKSADTKASPPIIVQLQKEISSIKDPIQQSKILEQYVEQLVTANINIKSIATKESFGAKLKTGAKTKGVVLRYSLIDGFLVPE